MSSSLLRFAILYSSLTIVSGGCALHSQTRIQNGVLVSAAETGDVAAARRALDSGADPNAPLDDLLNGGTPVICAVDSNKLEMVKLLLSRGARLNVQNAAGETPLVLAIQCANKPMAAYMLDHGAEPFELHRCAINNDTAAIARFHKQGVDINSPDKCGCTALLLACLLGRTQAVRCLLAAGADPNKADHKGFTPLYQAARHGHTDVVKMLVAAGANKTAKCANYTAREIADIYCHDDIVKFLGQYP